MHLRIWREIRVGTYRSKSELETAFENEGHRLTCWAKALFRAEEFLLSTKERTIELYTATGFELGFEKGKGASAEQFWMKLDSLGFAVCPHETALQLSLAYKDQPMNERRTVMTKPIVASGGLATVLLVEHNRHGFEVDCRYATDFWPSADSLVFCRR